MIDIGTKMREIDEDVWENYILKETKDEEFCIIDDLRFQNELNLLEKNGWRIIFLNISKELQIMRIKELYSHNYEDHIKNMNHLSEENKLVFKNTPIIIDSSKNIFDIINYLLNKIFDI